MLASISLLCSLQGMAQIALIANPGVKASSMSKKDVADVFTGRSTVLPGGSQVAPVLLKSGAVHEAFLLEFIGKSDATYRQLWRSLVFSGQADMPKSLDSDSAVVGFVAHTPGSIGYIGASSPHEGVKVLAIK
jgi:ABC-type phosphate transport system substrate-binding protein